jgi:hypothetical protein
MIAAQSSIANLNPHSAIYKLRNHQSALRNRRDSLTLEARERACCGGASISAHAE